MRDLDRFIQQVYTEAARQTDWRRSRVDALGTLAEACGADHALWITGTAAFPQATRSGWPSDAAVAHVTLDHLKLRRGERCRVLKPLPAASGRSKGQGVLLQYAHRGSELHSRLLLGFVRSAPSDLALLQRAGGHLIEAGSLTLTMLLERDEWLTALGRNARGPAALIDAQGRYYARSRAFTALIAESLGEAAARETALPVALPALGPRPDTLRTGALMLRLSPLDGLWLVHARLPRALDALSPREQEVARALGEGKTFKRIAQQLRLSASTVANHTASIYRKLGIFRREELLSVLRNCGELPPGR
jgi:DNA-binding CsgD family transcriptional regulator